MIDTLRAIFCRQDASVVAREQLFEAERLALEHQAAGELHSGLAAIYKTRAQRLRNQSSGKLEYPQLVVE